MTALPRPEPVGEFAYRAYSYLSKDTDARRFAMSPMFDRVPSRQPELEGEALQTLNTTLAQSPIISAHDHLGLRPLEPADYIPYRHQAREITAYEGLLAAGVDAFFDGGPAGVTMNHSHAGWGWEDTIYEIGLRMADWAHSGIVDLILDTEALTTKRAGRRLGIVLTLEAATPIGNEIDKLDVLYGLGVRSMGISYSESNALGSGLAETADGGLTRFGRECVRRMNDLGILIDVSHCGDRTALDVIEASTAPVSITHAGARAVWPTRRMKPDDVIRAMAESGGFIGIEAAPNTTRTSAEGEHDLDSVRRHLEHCIELVGVEHVALGPDTHFGDHSAWHRHFSEALSSKNRPGDPAFTRTEFVHGAENPAEASRNMLASLAARGYGAADLAAIAGGNVIRVARESWIR